MPKMSIKTLVSHAVRYLPPGAPIDTTVAIVHYVTRQRRVPRLRQPKLFNDHLLKLRIDGTLSDPFRQFVTDKEYVKQYVAGVVGQEYTIETFDVLRSSADVANLRLSRFPCVIKPTHMCKQVVFCLDHESPVDHALLTRWLRRNYYKHSRELNYRFLEPKIIVEEFFSADGKTPPADYKIFCFEGCPRLILVDVGRFQRRTRNFYDPSWNRLEMTINHPPGVQDERPANLEEMLDVARQLSKPFSFIRVDLYTIGDRIKIGELTNCHGAAGSVLRPRAAEMWLGSLFERGAGACAGMWDDQLYKESEIG